MIELKPNAMGSPELRSLDIGGENYGCANTGR